MPSKADEIVAIETSFWQSMADKDAAKARTMIADEALITGSMGAMKIDPAQYGKMTEDGNWTLKSFDFSDVAVVFANDDTAVIAYKVHQTGDMNGKPMDMTCADSSTWVRDGASWKCLAHAEAVLQA